jgi:hypothetical protein
VNGVALRAGAAVARQAQAYRLLRVHLGFGEPTEVPAGASSVTPVDSFIEIEALGFGR